MAVLRLFDKLIVFIIVSAGNEDPDYLLFLLTPVGSLFVSTRAVESVCGCQGQKELRSILSGLILWIESWGKFISIVR